MGSETFSPIEFMAYRAAKELTNGQVAFVGVGLPLLASSLARSTHAPHLTTIFESGVVGAVPSRLPTSVADPSVVPGSLSVVSVSDIFHHYLQGGLIDIGLLSGAQIDKHGNINSTVLGDYKNPQDRLPGSGGACEIAIHSKKLMIIMPMTKRTFVEKCDFITSPGFPTNKSPYIVVTNMGVCEFKDGEMVLTELCPGVTIENVKASCGWNLKEASPIKTSIAPTPEVTSLLKKIDPTKIYL